MQAKVILVLKIFTSVSDECCLLKDLCPPKFPSRHTKKRPASSDIEYHKGGLLVNKKSQEIRNFLEKINCLASVDKCPQTVILSADIISVPY